MIKKYNVELEGQIEFYEQYLKVINPDLTFDDIFRNNTDGILNGNLLEFKLNITDINACLFQSIKYLSAMRIKGEPIPSNILLVSLNSATIYVYNSSDYLKDIEIVYVSGASKENKGFIAKNYLKKLEYSKNQIDEYTLINLLKQNNYTKINIDENCIVGWAEKFYRENPQARKGDFIGDTTGKVKIIGEIREPNKFKNYIYAYMGKDNVRFQYLMDKLNDVIQKKNLGAFYTPEPYVEKSIELVREAIKKVPKGNDYIILDRCAGTGNLEKKLTDEELSHCIVSTIEYYEYKVLLEILGSKVRYIIPPIEKEDTFNMGLVRGADALSKEFINNPIIKQYLENQKCTIILFENPPYAEANGTTSIKGGWKKSFIVSKMKEEKLGKFTNDLSNAFIWSAFKYYLRQPTDSYIVYSPIKYWKAQHLISKNFIKGFAFNRRFFHTKIDACISCIYWGNEKSEVSEFILQGYDIDNKNKIKFIGDLIIKKINISMSEKYFDDRIFSDKNDGISCNLNGTEYIGTKNRVQKKYNQNIIGFLICNGTGFDNPDLNSGITTCGRYDGNGFFLRKDNYLEKLPMFCASRYITYNRNWTERARIMKSADGAEQFYKDIKNGKLYQFLLKCLVFTCFEMQNHMRSFKGSDGRFYRNELCLDATNGETIASLDLKNLCVNESEKKLFELWDMILSKAKETKNYNKDLTYGVYQIFSELNTFTTDTFTGVKIPDYQELNGHLRALKQRVKEYYNKEIVPILFKYEFLK